MASLVGAWLDTDKYDLIDKLKAVESIPYTQQGVRNSGVGSTNWRLLEWLHAAGKAAGVGERAQAWEISRLLGLAPLWGGALRKTHTCFLAIPPTYGNRQLCFYLRGITLLVFTRLS